MAKRRKGDGLAGWATAGVDGPIVVRITPKVAERLGVDLTRLQEAAAGMEPWGEHASGEAVFKVRKLLAVLGQLPESPRRRGWHAGRDPSKRRKAVDAP